MATTKPNPPSSFSTIPIIDLSLAASPTTKPLLLADLRHALLSVGFLYIRNTGIPPALTAAIVEQCHAFFALPDAEKLRVEMKNAASFLGYSRLGNEITKAATDWREQYDVSTEQRASSSAGAAHPDAPPPLYHNLRGPNQWPSPSHLPGFRATILAYLSAMSDVSARFTRLLAEAIGLAPDGFARFFDADQQHKLKLVKYPAVSPAAATGLPAAQGVGPHKDSMLTSFLLQASPEHATDALQVQNADGRWIDVPPVEDTLVVAIGQGMEALTGGVCASTTHRVLSPREGGGAGPRFSVPFFQGVSYDATFEGVDVPEEVRALKRQKGAGDEGDFQFVKGKWGHLGEATLANRVRSHPDVGERWYPELLARIRAEQAEQLRGKAPSDATARDGGVVVESQHAQTAVEAH